MLVVFLAGFVVLCGGIGVVKVGVGLAKGLGRYWLAWGFFALVVLCAIL
jgi:hypothetical protein